MIYLLSKNTNPYFNLAAEEYLLKNKKEDIFMLWRSAPCVVVGKHQNTLAEINYRYINENNIHIARRLSGGGTVVHDLQNLNFTFISNGKEGKLIDFKKFVSPVIDYLKTLGINARIGKKNDIKIDDLKISGNAEHIFKKRVLHHGTLLFNSDLKQLKKAIKVDTGVYFDKAVQSNRASVTNISKHLKNTMTIDDFINGLSEFICSINSGVIRYTLSDKEVLHINTLMSDKYITNEWIYGYSPKYRFEKTFEYEKDIWFANIHVQKGVIQECMILKNNRLHELSGKFIGALHQIDQITDRITSICNPGNSENSSEFAYNFF